MFIEKRDKIVHRFLILTNEALKRKKYLFWLQASLIKSVKVPFCV